MSAASPVESDPTKVKPKPTLAGCVSSRSFQEGQEEQSPRQQAQLCPPDKRPNLQLPKLSLKSRPLVLPAVPSESAMLKLAKAQVDQRTRISDQLALYDLKGDGRILLRDLMKVLVGLGCKLSEAELMALPSRLAPDAAGSVRVEDFDRLLQQAECDLGPEGGSGVATPRNRTSASELASPRSAQSVALEDVTPQAPLRSQSPWRRCLAHRPPRKPLPRPVTKGLAPSMCRVPPKEAELMPAWREILGLEHEEAPVASTCSSFASSGKGAAGSLRVLRPRASAAGRGGGEWEEQREVLPWPTSLEERQRIEWRIRHLSFDPRSLEMRYRNLPMQQGGHLTSPHFEVAGAKGHLKFWPNRCWRSTHSGRLRREMQIGDPSATSWFALGLFLPPGTHLQLRFFMGDLSSDFQDCYWGIGPTAKQLWIPWLEELPESIDDIVVGVEVRRNHRHLRPGEAAVVPTPCAVSSSPRLPAEALRHGPREGVARGDLGASAALTSRGPGRPLPSPRFARGLLQPQS